MSQSQLLDNAEESKVRFDDTNMNNYNDIDAKSRYYDQGEDKTFMTSNNNGGMVWKAFDFLFPAGKLAKLVRVYDVAAKQFPWGDILHKLKLTEGFPVINLIGAKECGRGKFYAGIARAAFNCDAIILDSGIQTGIEKYAIRRGIKLIGVAPENEIKFPKINPTFVDPLELSNGHTHLFLLNNQENDFVWTQEVWFKTDLALKLAEGRGPKGSKRIDGRPRCKIVHVLMGDTPNYADELKLAIKYNQPIIVVKGSKVSNTLIKKYAPKPEDSQEQQGDDQEQNNQNQNTEQIEEVQIDQEVEQILQKNEGHFFYLDSDDSEDIAQYLHFLLTVTPYEDGSLKKPNVQDLDNQNNNNGNYGDDDDDQYNNNNQPQQNNNQNGNDSDNDNN